MHGSSWQRRPHISIRYCWRVGARSAHQRTSSIGESVSTTKWQITFATGLWMKPGIGNCKVQICLQPSQRHGQKAATAGSSGFLTAVAVRIGRCSSCMDIVGQLGEINCDEGPILRQRTRQVELRMRSYCSRISAAFLHNSYWIIGIDLWRGSGVTGSPWSLYPCEKKKKNYQCSYLQLAATMATKWPKWPRSGR